MTDQPSGDRVAGELADQLAERLRRALHTVEYAAAPDAAHVARRDTAMRRARTRRHVAIAAVAALVVVVAGGVTVRTTSGDRSPDVIAADPADTNRSLPDHENAKDPAQTALRNHTVDMGDPNTWWRELPPDPRGPVLNALNVWTGREVLSIGGHTPKDVDQPVQQGAAFDPITDRWRVTADPLAELIATTMSLAVPIGDSVFFGATGSDGAGLARRYHQAENRWSTAAAPPGPLNSTVAALWTGSELLVWLAGPTENGLLAAYHPAEDRWSTDLPSPPIAHRFEAGSAWTGGEWLLWGGGVGDRVFADGARFDPASRTWAPMAQGPLSARVASVLWTGRELLVVTGRSPYPGSVMAHGDGAAYDPVRDAWRMVAETSVHPGNPLLWTGRYALLFAKGGVKLFDPKTNVWLSGGRDPNGGSFGISVWTGSEAITLGSVDNVTGGARFQPPDIDPPVAGEELWPVAMGDAIGLDWADGFRLNAVLGRRHGRFQPGINDVLVVGQRKLELWGDPAVIETLQPALRDLGLTITKIHPVDQRPTVPTLPAQNTPPDPARLTIQPGTLVVDASLRCVWLDPINSAEVHGRILVIWPFGTSVDWGQRRVTFADGSTAAHGDPVTLEAFDVFRNIMPVFDYVTPPECYHVDYLAYVARARAGG